MSEFASLAGEKLRRPGAVGRWIGSLLLTGVPHQTASIVDLVMRPQPLICLSDVEAGSRWFQDVLGLTSGHGGTEYEILLDGDEMVAQLHDWEADEHSVLGDPQIESRGNGVLLWFATDDVDSVIDRVRAHELEILDGPLDNPNSGLREVWVRGPEGYVVVVAGPAA